MPDSQDSREKQPNPAALPRQPAKDEILRARPVQGEIDEQALTRKIISQFPKILAELAK